MTDAVETKEERSCTSCEGQLEEQDRFCTSCGFQVLAEGDTPAGEGATSCSMCGAVGTLTEGSCGRCGSPYESPVPFLLEQDDEDEEEEDDDEDKEDGDGEEGDDDKRKMLLDKSKKGPACEEWATAHRLDPALEARVVRHLTSELHEQAAIDALATHVVWGERDHDRTITNHLHEAENPPIWVPDSYKDDWAKVMNLGRPKTMMAAVHAFKGIVGSHLQA